MSEGWEGIFSVPGSDCWGDTLISRFAVTIPPHSKKGKSQSQPKSRAIVKHMQFVTLFLTPPHSYRGKEVWPTNMLDSMHIFSLVRIRSVVFKKKRGNKIISLVLLITVLELQEYHFLLQFLFPPLISMAIYSFIKKKSCTIVSTNN